MKYNMLADHDMLVLDIVITIIISIIASIDIMHAANLRGSKPAYKLHSLNHSNVNRCVE